MTVTIHRRGALAALGGLAAAGLVAPAAAIEVQSMPLDEHGWKPAPDVAGAISWRMFGAVGSREEMINGFTWVLPVFTPAIQALSGKRIKVNGYMMPLEETPTQRRFLLMAYPPSCPFCLDVGSQYFMEVLARKPVKFTYDALLMEGRLELLQRDENGLYFRMHEAEQVRE